MIRSSIRSLIKIRELSQEVTRALVTARVNIQVLLVVSLCIPPLACRQDLSGNLSLLPPLLLNLLCDFSGNLVLLFVVDKNATAVLCADIRALTVYGGGIVHAVEEFEQFLVRDLVGVVVDLESFGVASLASANGAVAGVLSVATNVADSGVQHGVLGEVVAVHVLNTPEATCCYCGLLSTFRDRDGTRSLGSKAHGRGCEGARQTCEERVHDGRSCNRDGDEEDEREWFRGCGCD